MKLIVIDRRVALIPVDPGNYELGYLEITQPAMVQSLLDSFERHWGDATDPANHLVRTLMDRLGVENRFQLGVALGALGIVPKPPDGDEAGGTPES